MQSWPCPIPTCKKICRSPGGLTQHLNHKHHHNENFGKREKAIHRTLHPILDGWWDLAFLHALVLTLSLQALHAIQMVTTLNLMRHRRTVPAIRRRTGLPLLHKSNSRLPISCSGRQRCHRPTSILSCDSGRPQHQTAVHHFKTTRRC